MIRAVENGKSKRFNYLLDNFLRHQNNIKFINEWHMLHWTIFYKRELMANRLLEMENITIDSFDDGGYQV